MSGEWKDPHQRFELLHKLLQRTHREELKLAKVTVPHFVKNSKLSGFVYKNTPLKRANPLDQSAYIWARNLAALRKYQCPILFCEPYVMNSKEDYDYIQAGDYEGTRTFNQKSRPSIYEEYAEAVVEGILDYYVK